MWGPVCFHANGCACPQGGQWWDRLLRLLCCFDAPPASGTMRQGKGIKALLSTNPSEQSQAPKTPDHWCPKAQERVAHSEADLPLLSKPKWLVCRQRQWARHRKQGPRCHRTATSSCAGLAFHSTSCHVGQYILLSFRVTMDNYSLQQYSDSRGICIKAG